MNTDKIQQANLARVRNKIIINNKLQLKLIILIKKHYQKEESRKKNGKVIIIK